MSTRSASLAIARGGDAVLDVETVKPLGEP